MVAQALDVEAGESSVSSDSQDRGYSPSAGPIASYRQEYISPYDQGRFVSALADFSSSFPESSGTLINDPAQTVAPALQLMEARAEALRAIHGGLFSPGLLRSIIRFQSPRPPQARFIQLKRWEGYVEELTEDSFIARLVDSDDSSTSEAEAEILLSEVSDDDLELVVPGSVFYWTIGYRIEPAGQRWRASVIVFRRLPRITEHDVQAAIASAIETNQRIGWQ